MDRTVIETKGYREFVAKFCELTDLVGQLTRRVEALEYLMSEEIMAGLTTPADLREVVAELGHGWRIERQLTPPNESAATLDAQQIEALTGTGTDGVLGDSWLPADRCWVTQYAREVDG